LGHPSDRLYRFNHHKQYPGDYQYIEIPHYETLSSRQSRAQSISKRIYKPAFHHSEAEEIIAQARGKLFDPDIVDVFLRVREEFRKIALKYAEFDEERRLLSK
jgi:hypothetical protein